MKHMTTRNTIALLLGFWLVLMLIPLLAQAGSVTLSWTAPTQNEDGTPLTDLAGYNIYWGTTTGDYPNSVEGIGPAVTSYVVDNLDSGIYHFVATAFNTAGTESVYSNEAVKEVLADIVPNPPINLTVTQDTRVFTAVKTSGKFLLVAVGSIPAGTPCSPDYAVRGDLPNREGVATVYSVPVSAVTWSGSTETVTPVARCE